MWVPTTDLPTAPSHPFYRRLNQLLGEYGFDEFVEAQYAGSYGRRPSLPPAIYFRVLLIGYFEGIDSERGIAWAADSLALREFLGFELTEAPPDHSTYSRTRRRSTYISEPERGRQSWTDQAADGTRSMRIDVASAARAANGCCADGASCSNALRAFVRNRWAAANPRARPCKRLEAPADPREWVQSGILDAKTVRDRQAARLQSRVMALQTIFGVLWALIYKAIAAI